MDQILTCELPPQWREFETQLFLWSGFAIWTGIVARAFLRSRALRSPWLTLVLGFIGICLGPFLTRSFFQLEKFDPLEPIGIASSIIVAMLAIAFFHLFSFLSPRNITEDEDYKRRDEYDARENYEEYDSQYYSRKNGEKNIGDYPYQDYDRSPNMRNGRVARRYPTQKRRQNY